MAASGDQQTGDGATVGGRDASPGAVGGVDATGGPAWLGTAPVVAELDVRVYQAAGEDPFMAIQEAARTVGVGETLVLRSAFAPVPLYGVLQRKGFTYHAVQTGPDEWVVTFYRERAVVADIDADDTHPHGAA